MRELVRARWLILLVGAVAGYVFRDIPSMLWEAFVRRETIVVKSSPSKNVRAVVVRINPGAMSSFIHEVYLQSDGESALILSTENAGSIALEWQSDSLLVIRPENATCFVDNFRNYYQSPTNEVVRVRLETASFSFLVPDGAPLEASQIPPRVSGSDDLRRAIPVPKPSTD